MITIQNSLLSWGFSPRSLREIKTSGNQLNAPVVKHVRNVPKSPSESRTLSFFDFLNDPNETIKVFGIIGGYRFSFNPRYHQAVITLLLLDVWGINAMNVKHRLGSHMWVNLNLSMMCGNHNIELGLGDCILVQGHIEQYTGRLGRTHGFKLSLNDRADLKEWGYPVNLQSSSEAIPQLVPYSHTHYLVKAVGYSPYLTDGDEICLHDKKIIKAKKLYLGWTAENALDRLMFYGYHLSSFHHNPQMLLTHDKDKMHMVNNIVWKKYSNSKHVKLLTTAKQVKANPHSVYKSLKNSLFPQFKQSYYYLIAHHNLFSQSNARLQHWLI